MQSQAFWSRLKTQFVSEFYLENKHMQASLF